MDANPGGSRSDGGFYRCHQESSCSPHLAARDFGNCNRQRLHRLLLSRTWRGSSSRRTEDAALQHHVRAADLRPAAICSFRFRGPSCQSAAEGTMKSHSVHTADQSLVDPNTRESIQQMQQPGYYPGYSTLGQQNYWDEATRKV